MSNQAVFTASFVRLQTMADGSPRIILDADCSLAEIAKMNLTPGAPFAFARMTDKAAGKAQQEAFLDRKKGGPLSKEAAGLCKVGDFQDFVICQTAEIIPSGEEEAAAADYIRKRCGVTSRAELDHDQAAAQEFARIKLAYLEWLR